MAAIISSIDQLKKTVKVNAKLPYDAVEPFLQSARDIYLVRYLGEEMVAMLEDNEVPERLTTLHALVCKALGPLAVWMGNAELSVRISDSGFTVAKQDGTSGYAPASDTKIAKVEESLERRGFQYLDQVLEYLEANAANFPEWTNSRYYTLRGGNYIQSAVQFQELGLVDINYSRIKFENLRTQMSIAEQRFVTETIGETLDTSLRSKLNSAQTQTEPEKIMIATIRKFVACKCAGTPYYDEQAEYFYSKIQQLLVKYATELNVELATSAPEFNADDKRIYNIGG